MTELVSQSPLRPLVAAASLVLGALASGCNPQPSSSTPTQVAVKVNDDEISAHQVQVVLQRQNALLAASPDLATRKVLDSLIEQELAAQAAKQRGLDRDPQIVQAIEVAKREALARAWQDRLADTATRPSSDEVDRYYDSKPLLFAQRRSYTLQEFRVEASTEQLGALEQKLAQVKGSGPLSDAIKASGLPHTTRQTVQPAEDLPLALLDRLATFAEGQAIVLPRPGGASVLAVLRSELAPTARNAARKSIEAYLLTERKRHMVAQGMKSLRDAARIEYVGKFAQAPSAAASATVAR